MTNKRPRIPLDGHYSCSEAAQLLGVDRRTIYRWRELGYIRTKEHLYTSLPFIEGREILKVYDVCTWQKKKARPSRAA